jgi:hypothetical protein
VRQRRANDPEYRARLNENRLRYRQRLKAGLLPENAPQRPLASDDPWLRLWIRLNSESEAEVIQAKKDVRHRMDIMLAMTNKALANAEPKKEKVQEESKESFGLADEY